MANVDKNRLDYLDVLRGIAAMSVCFQHILGHVYRTYGQAHPLYPYIKFLIADSVDWGRFGVVLFFLISGFIIPNSLKPGGTLKRFFVSRFFRLYPAYWLSLLFIVLSAYYLGTNRPTFSYAQFFANVTMAPKLFGFEEMSGVFWTLFIELLFYGCCATLFRMRWLDNSLVMACVALSFQFITPLSMVLNRYFHLEIPVQFILFHLSFLFAGNLLRLAFVKRDRVATYSAAIFFTAAMLTIPVTVGFLFAVPEATAKGFVMFTSSAVIYAYFLAIALFMYAVISKSLTSPWMVRVGERSYSLYLLHMLCFVFVAYWIPPVTTFGFVVYFLTCIVVSYLAAKFSFDYVERPAIELGKRIVKARGYA
ncbi:MAG: acyltransferase family protein [Methylophilaceae bacterium]